MGIQTMPGNNECILWVLKMIIIDHKTNDYRIFYGHILFKKHAKFNNNDDT